MKVFSCFSLNALGSSLIFLSSVFLVSQSHATTVQFQTVMGNIEVNLFDKTTPETVKNFLAYVNSGAYANNVIHRSDKSLDVIQGGGLTYPGALPLTSIKRKPSVVNEPVYSNVRGTLAMAKQSGKPDSATSEWYFNLKDNSSSLDPNDIYDTQSYTVFGQVTEASLPVLDAIAAVDTFIIGSYANFPLRNYTVDDYKNNVAADDTNLVLITNIVVLNASPDTADSLTPAKNTLLKLDDNNSDGGGSLGLIELLLLLILLYSAKDRFYRRQK